MHTSEMHVVNIYAISAYFSIYQTFYFNDKTDLQNELHIKISLQAHLVYLYLYLNIHSSFQSII